MASSRPVAIEAAKWTIIYFIVQYIVHGGGAVMLAVNYSTARENFKAYCDQANDEVETIIITRKQGGNVVSLSEGLF